MSNDKATDQNKEGLEPQKVDENEEVEEIWDIVEAYAPHTKKIQCSNESCDKLAVATWATNLEPNNKWHSCEKCQETDFGGWPNEFDVPDLRILQENDTEKNENKGTISSNENGSDNFEANLQNKIETKMDRNSPRASNVEKVDQNEELKGRSNGSDSTKRQKDSSSSCESEASTKKQKVADEELSIMSQRSSTQESQYDLEEDSGEQWILSQILSLEDIQSKNAPCCSTDGCPLQACSLWTCSSDKDADPWLTCLDCQEVDFDGWPPIKEVPKDRLEMSIEHLDAIAELCTRQDKPKLPPQNCDIKKKSSNLNHSKENDSPSFIGETSSSPSSLNTKKSTTNLTPPPRDTLTKCHSKDQRKKSMVTPSPVPPNGSSKSRPSATALAMHRKWQDAAIKMGGKDARIIVSKPAAKKIILELLSDSFKPMNITDIYHVSIIYQIVDSLFLSCTNQTTHLHHDIKKALKAVVPSPVLKSCLDDMVENVRNDDNPFDKDSDEEDYHHTKKNKAKDEFAASLVVKTGRSTSTTLYFTNYNKLKNNGNGMDRDERNMFLGEVQKVENEKSSLEHTFNRIKNETIQLLSEPQNEKVNIIIQEMEKHVEDTTRKVEILRNYKGNEKKRLGVQKKLQKISAIWRQRRRLTIDFLSRMEEYTDGSISRKKCLKGDGAIEIDSDECHVKGNIAWAKTKRKRKTMKKRVQTCGDMVKPDESFVGVLLDNRGNIERVYLEDE